MRYTSGNPWVKAAFLQRGCWNQSKAETRLAARNLLIQRKTPRLRLMKKRQGRASNQGRAYSHRARNAGRRGSGRKSSGGSGRWKYDDMPPRVDLEMTQRTGGGTPVLWSKRMRSTDVQRPGGMAVTAPEHEPLWAIGLSALLI